MNKGKRMNTSLPKTRRDEATAVRATERQVREAIVPMGSSRGNSHRSISWGTTKRSHTSNEGGPNKIKIKKRERKY